MDYALNLQKQDIAVKQNDTIINNILFNKFITYTDVNDITMRNYTTDLKALFSYFGVNGITKPKREDIINYKKYLTNLNLSTGTKQQYFRTCKHFFKWLSSENLYPNIADNIKGFKLDKTQSKKESFKEIEIKDILNSIDKTTIQGKRDYAIILLIITGDLRLNEVRTMDISDMEIIKGDYVIYFQGKGHSEKDARIKIITPVYNAIQDYLSARGNYKKNDPLFVGTSNRAYNQRLTKETLSQIIKNRLRQAGYDSDKYTCHSLRHTSTSILYKSGADIYRVQQHARHKDPKTTEIYIHDTEKENYTNEWDIYNQIFNTNNQETLTELRQTINKLNDNELKDVLSYINSNIMTKKEV